MLNKFLRWINKRKLNKEMNKHVPSNELSGFAHFEYGYDHHFMLERYDKSGVWIVTNSNFKIKDVLPFSS